MDNLVHKAKVILGDRAIRNRILFVVGAFVAVRRSLQDDEDVHDATSSMTGRSARRHSG